MRLQLVDLFPPGVAVVGGPHSAASGRLYPAEARLVERAVARRRHEFAAGRCFAREALAQIGVPPQPILAEDRRPLWPAGTLGSITHTEGRCAAAVARQGDFVGVGLDVERRDAVTPDLHRHVLTAGERDWLQAMPERDRDRWATLTFSAKEALYKSLAGLNAGFIGFDEVCIAHEAEGAFQVRAESAGLKRILADVAVRGRAIAEESWVWTAVTLSRPG